MNRLRKHIALFLVLVFVYPEVSASLHFLFFHKNKVAFGVFQASIIHEKGVDCNYGDIKYYPFTSTKSTYSFFLLPRNYKVKFYLKKGPELKKRYLFNLRAPPVVFTIQEINTNQNQY